MQLILGHFEILHWKLNTFDLQSKNFCSLENLCIWSVLCSSGIGSPFLIGKSNAIVGHAMSCHLRVRNLYE